MTSDQRFSWTANCSNGTGVLSDGGTGEIFTSTPLTSSSVVLDVPQPKPGVEVLCSVNLSITDVSGSSTSCGQNVLFKSCELGCMSEDISKLLATIDGNLLAQKALTAQAIKVLRAASRQPKQGKKEMLVAEKLYSSGWNFVWQFPAVLSHCTNAVACVTTDNTPVISQFGQNVRDFFELTESLLKKAKRFAGKKGKFASRIQKLEKANAKQLAYGLESIAQVPASQSRCD
jgi:hypothetical protein